MAAVIEQDLLDRDTGLHKPHIKGFCWGVSGWSMLLSDDRPNGAGIKPSLSAL
jgi:hypothetical protein